MSESKRREAVFIESLTNSDAQHVVVDDTVRVNPGAMVMSSVFDGPAILNEHSWCGPDVRMGRYVGIGRLSSISRTNIGNFCSVGFRSSINPFNHPIDWLSIHEFQYHAYAYDFVEEYRDLQRIPRDRAKAQRTSIGNDVWIGNNVNVFAGITIGDGAVIGAGSVVLHDVPSYAIVAGIPAKVRRMRFDPDTIARLLAVQWWNMKLSELSGLPFDNIEQCLTELERRQTGM